LEKPFVLIETVQKDIDGKDEAGDGRGGFIPGNA
jgi:hypothetical protein